MAAFNRNPRPQSSESANIQAETFVMTDEASWYRNLAKFFDTHASVNHSGTEFWSPTPSAG